MSCDEVTNFLLLNVLVTKTNESRNRVPLSTIYLLSLFLLLRKDLKREGNWEVTGCDELSG